MDVIIIIKNIETIKSFFIYRLFNYLFVKETIKTVGFFLLTLSTRVSKLGKTSYQNLHGKHAKSKQSMYMNI